MDASYIGTTSFGSRNKKNWLYVKSEHEKGGRPGGSNPYRIFPPFGALASEGKVYEYWSHHEVTNSKGERRSFACIEEMDWKTKMIKVHCPFCETYKSNKAQYDVYKAQGASKDDLAAYNANHVQPYQSQGRYYLNAINLEGQIGVLALTSKSYKAFRALFDTYHKQGFDITGGRGMFLNFTKVSQYKGDNQPLFGVDLLKDTSINPNTGIPEEKMRAPHDLTPDIIARMKTECFELNAMYKRITPEQMDIVLTSAGPARGLAVDSIFALPDREAAAPANDPSKVRIGNSDMYAVGHLNHTPTGPELVMPNLNYSGNTEAAPPLSQGLPNNTTASPLAPGLATPTSAQQLGAPSQPLSAPPLSAAPAMALATPAAASAMTDEEFKAAFGNL